MFVGPFDARAQGGQLFSARWLWNDLGDELLSCFFQRTSGLACFWVAHDCAVRRIRSFTSYTSEREGFRICPIGMAVVALEENGTVRKNFVQILLMWQRLGAEHGIVPATAENPAVSRMFAGVFAQSFLDVNGVRGAFQIYAAQAQGAIQEMNVGIDKTRKNESAVGVDDFRASAAQLFDFCIAADGDDFCAANGYGLHPRLFCVFRVDAAVKHDGVSGSSVCALCLREQRSA